MATFAKGAVVLVPFPFSDLTQAKRRPALVLADAGRGDFLLCQITSNPYADPKAIALDNTDFARGGLARISYIRPTKLFTAHTGLILADIGQLAGPAAKKVINAIVTWLKE